MVIRYCANGTFEVEEPTVFDRFTVDANGVDLATLQTAFRLTGAGHLDREDAFICNAYIRLAVGKIAHTDSWRDGFARMVDYAKSKNWTSAEDHFICAHIENLALDNQWLTGLA